MVAACHREPERSPPPRTLADTLRTASTLDAATCRHEVASWRLDEAAWRRIVVESYRPLYADYAAAFVAAEPELVTALAGAKLVATRPHFAGDPALTPAQARTRWALPVAFASEVATLDGKPLDVVFLRDGDHWRAIAGLDRVIRARVASLDPTCAGVLDLLAPPPRCRDIGWEIAEAALRTDRGRFAHACTLATSLCGKPTP